MVLNWRTEPGPENDHVAGATAIAGRSGAIAGDVRGATHEPDEPGHADSWGLGSVWYRWSAPQAGTVSFDAEDSQFGPALAVYRLDPERSGMSALEPVEARYPRIEKDRRDRVEFVAAENATYLIAVDRLHARHGERPGADLDHERVGALGRGDDREGGVADRTPLGVVRPPGQASIAAAASTRDSAPGGPVTWMPEGIAQEGSPTRSCGPV